MRRILLIEDEPAICDFLRRVVERLGHQAQVAVSAAEALKLLAQGSFDLVIADLGLPDAPDTRQWIAELGQQAGGAQVILSSGNIPPELKAAAQEAGIGEFLAKPFELATLRQLIDRCLSRAE